MSKVSDVEPLTRIFVAVSTAVPFGLTACWIASFYPYWVIWPFMVAGLIAFLIFVFTLSRLHRAERTPLRRHVLTFVGSVLLLLPWAAFTFLFLMFFAILTVHAA